MFSDVFSDVGWVFRPHNQVSDIDVDAYTSESEPVIQEHRMNPAGVKREAGLKLLDHLSLTGQGLNTRQLEIALVKASFGHEVGPAQEGFEVRNSSWDEAMNGFGFALVV